MHVAGDLGFSSLVVLVLVSLLAPAIGVVVIRRKWRLAVARKEEIRRLLVMASEEAARAELEATYAESYSAVSVLPKNTYQCAVCYSPTTTRCSRCKAVRYCSGKCQIIHWRQGHKEECHPPNITSHNNDEKSGIVWKAANQEPYKNYDDRWEDESIETSFKESVLSDSSHYPGVPHLKLDSDAHANVGYSTSESSGSSFSGFSTPSTGSKSSDEASVGESICSSEPEGLDRLMAADVASDMNASKLSSEDQAKLASPKFARLANSVDKFNKLKKLDQSKSCLSEKDSNCTSSRSSDHRISPRHDDTIPKLDKISSANDSSSNVENDTTVPSFGGAVDSNLSNSESFLHFKFNLSGNSCASSHQQSKELNDTMLDDAPTSPLQMSKPINAAVLSESTRMDVPKVPSALSMSFEKSKHNKVTDSNVSKSGELKCERSDTFKLKDQMSNTGGDFMGSSSSKFCGSVSSTPERRDVARSDPVTAARPAKFQLSSGVSQTHLTSSVSEDSVSGTRLRKAENIRDAVTSPQGASFSPNSSNGLKSSVLKVVDQIRGPKYGRHSDKGLFPYELFVKLYTSNKVEMLPCGLINCGNSCYANAVLQCLAFTPPLTAYFVQGLHSKACSHREWCFTCEFENLILKAKGGKSPISPDGIISQLKNIGSQLGHGREEDAHEFLRYAIDAMQAVCLKEAGVNGVGSFEEETTLIGLTFGGYLRSKIKCMKCHYKSERQERMMDLTVEIEGDVARLEDALRRFTATEILDGDNKYECSRCKSYEKAKKKFTIVEAPNVLTIALKRFQSGKFGKLNKSICFPEILDLAPYMSGTSDKSPIYRLYGVVVHLDIMNASFSGHYVCYVKNIQNKWFKIDDSTVTAVELERVLNKGAYMLLYARCSPRAPRLMRNRNKSNPSGVNAKNISSNSRFGSTHPSVVQLHPSSIPQDTASVQSFFLKFHHLQKILEEDSSSDNFSFTSSNSDEGSCSTDSTRDSTSTDDLTDYIFGGWGNSWRNTPDADTYSSSSSSPSPSYPRHSTDASSDHPSDSGSLNSIRYQVDRAGSSVEGAGPWVRMPDGRSKSIHIDGRRGDHFLQSDTLKQCRKLVDSNSCRENDSATLGGYVKSTVSFRRSTSERTS